MAYTYNYSLLLSLLDGTSVMSTETYAETKVAMSEVTKEIVLVADDAVDQVISLGGVTTASMVMIKSNQTVSIKFNTLDAISGKLFFMKGTSVTSIKASNSSGSTATLQVLVAE